VGASGNKLGRFFFGGVPESSSASRHKVTASLPRAPSEPSTEAPVAMTRGEMRLRVVNSLSDRHQNYVFGIVRNRCAEYLAKTSFDITADELLSQLWEKLVRGASLPGDE
jgi:hypothetical protein